MSGDTNLSIALRDGKAATLSEADVVSRIQKLGQDCYGAKQYANALLAFTELIENDAIASMPIFTTVLDNRAATYVKLGNLQAALNDGRQMIEREKTNSTGYLRTGKTLQLAGNKKMALKLYEMALRKVPYSDFNYGLLRCMRQKLYALLNPSKCVDPLMVLPHELGKMVMTSLDFRQRVRLLRVSKGWNEFLCSVPRLWSHLDFSKSNANMKLQAVRKYIKLAKGTVTQTTFDSFGASPERVPRYITTRCKHLEKMVLPAGLLTASILDSAPCAPKLKTLILLSQCHTTIDAVNQLLQHCHGLERAEFHSVASTSGSSVLHMDNLPNLQSLTLRCRMPPKGAPDCRRLKLSGGFFDAPNLTMLSLTDWFFHPNTFGVPPPPPDFSTLQKLEDLDISGMLSTLPPVLPSSLRTLDMSRCGFGNSTLFVSPNLPLLNRLAIADISRTTFNGPTLDPLRAMLLSNKGNLTHLDASGVIMQSEIEQLLMEGYLGNVKELMLNRCGSVNDKIGVLLAQNLPKLRALHLAFTQVTGVTVKELITKHFSDPKVTDVEAKGAVTVPKGNLKFLCVDDCNSMGIDAVEWARSKGLIVAFSFPDLKTGRKIR